MDTLQSFRKRERWQYLPQRRLLICLHCAGPKSGDSQKPDAHPILLLCCLHLEGNGGTWFYFTLSINVQLGARHQFQSKTVKIKPIENHCVCARVGLSVTPLFNWQVLPHNRNNSWVPRCLVVYKIVLGPRGPQHANPKWLIIMCSVA